MILNNLVIDIVENDTPPVYPPDPEGNIITAVECDDSIKLGMGYYIDTGFGEYKIPPKNYLNLKCFCKKYKRKTQTSKIQL